MTQFTDLPNEIVAMIAETVFPRDIVNFSAASKRIQSLSEPSLQKHHEMKLEYKCVKCTKNGTSLSDFLHDVVLQPTVALYVERLTIGTWSNGWHDGSEASHTTYPQEKMVTLEEAVAASVPSDQVLTWVTALKSGDEDPVLALLLLRLPNVAALSFRRAGLTFQYLVQTLIRLLETPGTLILSSLTTLEIHRESRLRENQTWQAINILARLPSLRSITGWNIKDQYLNDDDDSEYLLPPRSSNVSSLTILRTCIGAQQLHRFLQGFKALKRLTHNGLHVYTQDAYETFRIRAALLPHAKASLEYLNLSIFEEGHEKSYMGSLRDFENLTEVHTSLASLMNAEDPSGRVLAKMLPASVEKVHLHEELYHTPETIQDLITGAAEDKQNDLPNLKELHISLFMSRMDPGYKEALVRIQAKCKDAGFDFFIHGETRHPF